MLRRTLFYIVIGLSLTTISCKDSKKSNSDNKAKTEVPAPQPLPEIPHSDNPVDGKPNDGNQNPGFSDGERRNVTVSRKFCIKVIHGKYIPSLHCGDFNPYKEYKAYRWCKAKTTYKYPSTGYSTYSSNKVQFHNSGYNPSIGYKKRNDCCYINFYFQIIDRH